MDDASSAESPTKPPVQQPDAPQAEVTEVVDAPGVFARLIGPPLEALKRTLAAIMARLSRALGGALEFWRFLFLGPLKDEDGEQARPTRTALLLASVVLAVTLYSWPLPDILPPWLFIPLAIVVLVLAYRAIQFWSLRGSGNKWETWLRVSERRVGLIWWERLGFLIGAVGTIAALPRITALPLTSSVALGFLVLLGQPPDQRELRSVRVAPPLPLPLSVPPEQGDGGPPADGYVQREFSWDVGHLYGTESHQLTLYLHTETYESFKAMNPGFKYDGDLPMYQDYIVAGTTHDIERACAALGGLARESHYSTYEEVTTTLAFVQAIPYSLDRDSTGSEEYWRYPVETLYDATGDCEDTSILAAALLRRLGHDVAMLNAPGHAAIAVATPPGVPGRFLEFQGKRWYYCETTSEGWAVGEIPDGQAQQDFEVFPVPAFKSGR